MNRSVSRTSIGLVVAGTVLCALLLAAAAAPARSRIVWSRFDADGARRVLMSSRPDGGGLLKLTHPPDGSYDIDAQISPDGSRVLYERDLDPDGNSASFRVVRSNGRHAEAIDLGCVDPCVVDLGPTWFPDANRFAFTRVVGPFDGPGGSAASAVLHSAKLDGSDRQRLSEAGIDGVYEDYFARFSPDGSYIVFTRNRNQPFTSAVFRMNADGTHVRRLTPWGLDADLAVLSPATAGATRDRIAFETYGHGPPRGKSQNIATVPSTCRSVGSCSDRIRFLTHNTGAIESGAIKGAFNPAWSPNGRQIAYTKFKIPANRRNCCVGDIYRMRANGRDRRPVSTSGLFEYRPAWGLVP